MIDLFRSELLRFRAWCGAYALLHFGLLAFFGRMVDPLQQPAIVYEVAAAVYGLSGLLLALYQMGSYRRPNTWLILLHRPLPHWQVAAALLGAGACLMLLAVVLPLLLMLAGQAGLTARVVDARHWLLPLAAWVIAACSYLAGCFAMLAPRRIAAAALVLPLLFTASNASGPSVLLVQGAVLAWLLALVFFAFKPDLSRPPSRWRSALPVALTVQMAVYLLLCTGALAYQLLWMVQGSHPLNSAPPAGGYIEASRSDGADLIVAGLADSRSSSAPLWREQARLAEVFTWRRQFDALPVRNELGNIAPMEFDDEARHLRWIFSHDRMRLVGVNLVDGKHAGTLGLGLDHAPFPRPVLPTGGRFLISTDTLYAYDTHARSVLPRIALPRDETFAIPPSAMGEMMFAASDRALYTFDARAFADGDALLQPRQRIALPGRIGDLDRVDVIELIDGYLLSFVFGVGSTDGPGTSVQKILQMHGDGRVVEVARRALAPDFPTALRYYPFWLSPAMHALRDGATRALSPAPTLKRRAVQATPASMWQLALLLMLACVPASLWLSRRQQLVRKSRVAWVIASAAIGLPALLSQRLIHPDGEA